MMVLAVDRVLVKVPKRIIHPAHVPLHGTPEPAFVGWVRDAAPRGGFFGDGQHAIEIQVNSLVHRFQQINRAQVFTTAVLVGNPLAFFSAVIQIQHRSDRINAEPIDVVFIKPKYGV